MTLEIPDFTDIEVEIDGRQFRGAYSVMLGDLVVYYNGHTSSVRKPTTNLREVAVDLLRELVREHHVDISSLSSELPQAIRDAALAYVNGFDDDTLIRDLIESFGSAPAGSVAHSHVSRLCLEALQPIVPFWKFMCDDEGPVQIVGELNRWITDRSFRIDWESARRPFICYRDGQRVQDCDACRVEPIAQAVAHCADYLQTGNMDSAVATLAQACAAYDEGCSPEGEERSFEQWLVEEVLLKAYRFKPGEASGTN
jgi:hypothetical protein